MLPKKKRVAISKASREVTSESGPPWHLWTKVRGAPGSWAEGLLDQTVAAVIVRAELASDAKRRGSASSRLPDHMRGSWCRPPSAPGSEDTELGVLMELEVGHGETEVYAGVQA